MTVYRTVQLTNEPNIVIGDINDITGEINIKGAWKFGVKDLTADVEFAVPSGEEFDVRNFTIANKVFDYGVIRCHGNCVITPTGKLKICANAVFRFVR